MTAKLRQSRLATYIYPAIGDEPVDRIGTADVANALEPLADKKETRRKLVQYLSDTFKWAIEQEYRKDDPTTTLTRHRTSVRTEHHRWLPYGEVAGALARVWESGAAETTKLATEFLVRTCARSGEVRGARWDEIDEYSATWVIPDFRMKSMREHRVPLTDPRTGRADRGRPVPGQQRSCVPERDRSCHVRQHLVQAVQGQRDRDNTPRDAQQLLDVGGLRPGSTASSPRCAWHTISSP